MRIKEPEQKGVEWKTLSKSPRQYQVQTTPFEMEKDRPRAYFSPSDLRVLGVRPGTLLRIYTSSRNEYAVLRAAPKFDGEDGVVCLPQEEVDYLQVQGRGCVEVDRHALDPACPAAEKVSVHFSHTAKTVEMLESVSIVLREKKVVRNGERILGGEAFVQSPKPKDTPTPCWCIITEQTRIHIDAGVQDAPRPCGLDKEVEQMLHFIQAARENPSATRGLLVSGAIGMGKKTLCRYVVQTAGVEWVQVRVRERTALQIKEAYEYVCACGPGILWIERIDRLFEREEENIQAIELLESIFEDIHTKKRKIAVIATAKTKQSVPAELKTFGVLDRAIHLFAPSVLQREVMIQAHIDKYRKEVICECDLGGSLVRAAAKKTAGYTRGEIAQVLHHSLSAHKLAPANLKEQKKHADLAELEKALAEIAQENTEAPKPQSPTLSGTERCCGGCASMLLCCIARIIPSTENEKPLEIPDVRFESVIGQDDAKQRLREAVIWPLKHRELFAQLGIQAAKGVLLYGPPGCGKTLLAQALANESGAVFFSIRGPEIMGKYVGESEERIRHAFLRAREHAPSILFIDEIDSITPHRETEGGQVDKRVVSTLLTEMDGIGRAENVFVLGATNKPWSIDSALMRPGRLDHHVLVDLPTMEQRRCLLLAKISAPLYTLFQHMEKEATHKVESEQKEKEVEAAVDRLTKATQNYTAAEIVGLGAEVSMQAARMLIQNANIDPQSISDGLTLALQHLAPRLSPQEIGAYRTYTQGKGRAIG